MNEDNRRPRVLTPANQNQEEMRRLLSFISVTDQLPPGRACGMFLRDRLAVHPELIKYYRTCYDYARWWQTRPNDFPPGSYARAPKANRPVPLLRLLQQIDGYGDRAAAWFGQMRHLSAMAQAAATRVLDRKLLPGDVDGAFVNKIFERLGQPLIEQILPF